MQRRNEGFTLIELIVTMVIVGILMSMAAPSFTRFLQDAKLGGQARALSSEIQRARSEAARLNQNVVICNTTDNSTCTASAVWGRRIIFLDNNSNNIREATEEILRVSDSLNTNQTLAGPASGFVQFRSSGQANLSVTFKICDGRIGNFGRLITIATTGRSEITMTNCP